MVQNILVFVPDSLHLTKSGYLQGVRREYEECEVYYITSDVPVKENSGRAIGNVGDVRKWCPGVYINPRTSEIKLVNCRAATYQIVRIIYDFQAFRDCDTVLSETQYGVHFRFLSQSVKRREVRVENGHASVILTAVHSLVNCLLLSFDKTRVVWKYSATVSHFCDDLKESQLLLRELLRPQRMSLRSGNFLISRLFDLVLGLWLLQLFIANENYVVNLIEAFRETIIHNFRDLLIYLMGSPIGLKLNYSFNNSLGTFFFYHISLWRVFLITMHPFLRLYFKLLVLPGAFGFSYQLAMLSDMISVATFHVYCIYVYAARLFFLQLKGLLSLWRLFIGRKYNPLRARVDSHHYSQHQLFIGTLGFTVLLFLLPTTAMYYTVFVTFRLAILILVEIVRGGRRALQCLPFYIVLLYLVKSPLLSGPVILKPKKSTNGVATFEAHMKMQSFISSMRVATPERQHSGGSISLGKVLTGAII